MSLSAPSKFGVVWNNSDINRNTIPVASQIGITAGLASYTDGFPPLTMTPVASGGIPPFGQDFNGIFYAVTSALQWIQAGASYPYDSTFQTTIGGYPAGALVQRSDGLGWWLNTVANNATAPESGGAGWVPENGPGSTAITMTSSNVTLTSLQAGLGAIVITGTLTANLNLIFPTYQMQWDVINNTTGAFTITAKTAAGTGVSLVSGANQIYCDGTNINSASSLVVTRPTGDNSTAAASTAWANNLLNGQTNIALTNANVTLTAGQYGVFILNCTGTLTGNVVVFLPASTGTWQVRNSTTGAFTVTFAVVGTPGTTFAVPNTAGGNTATIYSDGTNVVNGNTVSSAIAIEPIQSISASVASNAMTAGYAGGTLQFRSATLTNGTPTTLAIGALSLTIPTGATLGSVSAVQSQFVYAVAYNAGTPVLCVANISGGLYMSETGLLSATAITSGATSAATWYSTGAVTSSPYRIIGTTFQTEATAGTYATAPSLVQGQGGEALAALMSLGYGQTWQNVTASRALSTTYYNTTGKPRFINVSGYQSSGTAAWSIQLTIGGISAAITGIANGDVFLSWLPVSGIVPPGASYSVVSTGAVAVEQWSEFG